MNRIDRLTAILLYLQGGKRTAGEIAERFEVSRRTILRDIQALGEMGVPIIADLGVSGGYTLAPDYILSPLRLTFNEALLLRLALGSLSQLGGAPFKDERESLQTKIQTLLPDRLSEDIADLPPPISLDPPKRSFSTPFLGALVQSAQDRRQVAVTYRSEKGVSRQTLSPIRLHTTEGLWYCDAYSEEREETRMYRVDRFLDVALIPSPSPLKASPSMLPHVDPSFPEACVRLTERGMLRLEREPHLSRHLQAADGEGGWLRLRLRPDQYDWLARTLLGLGVDATVTKPLELRQRVEKKAAEIIRHYDER